MICAMTAAVAAALMARQGPAVTATAAEISHGSDHGPVTAAVGK
jgi:hypothetical protein